MDNLDITAFIEKIKDTYTVLKQLEIIKEYFNTFSDKTNEVIDNVNNINNSINNIQVDNYEYSITNDNEITINLNKENSKILLINVTFYNARSLKVGEITINDSYANNTYYDFPLSTEQSSSSFLGTVSVGFNIDHEFQFSPNLISYSNPYKCVISVLYK